MTGFDAVAEEVGKGKVSGVLLTSDLSEKTKKEARFVCGKAGVPVNEIPETLDDIKDITGKRTGVIAVLDEGLYGSLIKSTNH